MSARRFMINSPSVRDGSASFDGEIYKHMVRVLRLESGDAVLLADENGIEYCGEISKVTKAGVTVKITSSRLAAKKVSQGPQITVCQALPKGDKIDLILQKGTELGAHDFWLFGGCRSVAKLRNEQQISKLDRWNRITTEAARQCGRPDIPEVSWKKDAVEASSESDHVLRLILWEGEKKYFLKDALSAGEKLSTVIIAIGPEGGFDPQELHCFTEQGFLPVSLGSRILRTETASIAILSIIQYISGEM